ncbi:MAG: fibronectin type III domain-containing protein [Gammaproteobacteria bacterium]|nr:fibronectin type III domain-containing protein [Gammaproteobacteria bacterium]
MFNTPLFRLGCLLGSIFLISCAATTDQEAAQIDDGNNTQVEIITPPDQSDTAPPDQADTIPPDVPENFRVIGSSSNGSVVLSWDESVDNVSVSGYRIFRNNNLVATVTTNLFSDTGLAVNTTYQYIVEAFDAENNSARSSVLDVAISIVSDQQSPTVPGNLLLTYVTVDQVSISWTSSTDNVAVSGYRIFRDGVLLNSTNLTSFTDSTVNDNTSYQYIVEAFDAENNTARSNALNVTTLAADDLVAPEIPVNLNSTNVTTSQITFSWTASTDNVGVVGYRVYKNYSNTYFATTTSTSFTDSGLTSDQTYVYSVSAIDAAGNESLQSDIISIDTQAVVVTQPVTLNWQVPTQNTDDSCLDGIQSYTLNYGMSSGNYSSTVNLDPDAGQISCVQSGFDNVCGVPIMTCNYTVDSLDSGTWYFIIQATDLFGVQSGYSNEASKLVN